MIFFIEIKHPFLRKLKTKKQASQWLGRIPLTKLNIFKAVLRQVSLVGWGQPASPSSHHRIQICTMLRAFERCETFRCRDLVQLIRKRKATCKIWIYIPIMAFWTSPIVFWSRVFDLGSPMFAYQSWFPSYLEHTSDSLNSWPCFQKL